MAPAWAGVQTLRVRQSSLTGWVDWLVSQVPEDLAVYNILLEGHGGSVSDFSKASMKKWKTQVEQCIRQQEHCGRRVVLVGHSLGALLALDAQRKHTCVESLLLLNVPLCPAVKPEMMGRSLRFAFGRVRREDPLDHRVPASQAQGRGPVQP